jgi:hypothetical protein
MGTSSMSRGMSRAPPISVAQSAPAVTVSEAVGSPSSAAWPWLTRAPMASSTSRTPVRVGFTPTRCSVTRASPTIAPATSRNAADEMSPGTTTDVARRGPGQSVTVRSPVSSRAPKRRSIRSE